MFEGLPLTANFRAKLAVYKAARYNPFTGERIRDYKVRQVGEKVLKADRLRIKAEKLLIRFCNSYLQTDSRKETENLGWSKIKKYSRPGTAFLYAEDPIGKDTIVVSRRREKDTNTTYVHFYWVSDQINPRTNMPFVYRLCFEEDVKGDITPEAQLFPITFSKSDAISEARNMFKVPDVLDHPYFGIEYEIWKEGKALPMKQKEVPNRTVGKNMTVHSPVPVPI
jgi:hypothetical protein